MKLKTLTLIFTEVHKIRWT